MTSNLCNLVFEGVSSGILDGVADPRVKDYLLQKNMGTSGILNYFLTEFRRKWQASNRTKDVFLKKNDVWLKREINVEEIDSPQNTSNFAGPGRPQVSFLTSSEKNKKEKMPRSCSR